MALHTTPEVDAQIRAINDWWRANRLSSPDLFVDELAASFVIIEATPQIGRPYRRSPVNGTRRLLLKATRYHIYYAPLDDDLIVLALWHARRGEGPPLRL